MDAHRDAKGVMSRSGALWSERHRHYAVKGPR